jgi:hypothetical protein
VWTTIGVGANMASYHVVIGDMSYWTIKKDVLRVTSVIKVIGGGVSLLLQLVNHKIMNKNKTKTIITTERRHNQNSQIKVGLVKDHKEVSMNAHLLVFI